jgi:two-component system, LytTR family, response regulator
MIQCIIIDDRQEAIDIVISHLESKPEIHLVKIFTNPILGLDFIINNTVDLVFLDIDMPQLSGIELIESLKEKNGFKLPDFILTTGHQEFALKGFEYGVIDYILKPVSFKRFNIAVDRYLNAKATKTIESKGDDGFFFGESEGKKIRIDIEDIIYIEGSGNYISLYKKDRRLVLLRTLNEMEKMLDSNAFMRIHKSYIVAIKKIDAVTNNEAHIKYKDENIILPIGRTFKEEFMKRLKLS